MNIKRYIGATAALFAFIFCYEWLIHGYLLASTYRETPQVWRDFADMSSRIPLGICLQVVLCAWLALAFAQIYKQGGWAKGLVFGVYFGMLAGILSASWYLYLPVAGKLGWSWWASSFAEGAGGGLILGSIYRK